MTKGVSVKFDGLNQKVVNPGSFNILFAKERSISNKVFESLKSALPKVVAINMPFRAAIKVPNYFKKFIDKRSILELKKEYDINSLSVDKYSWGDGLILACAGEYYKNYAIILEPAGLDYYSIIKLAEACHYLCSKKKCIIILIMFEASRPPFEWAEIDQETLFYFEYWCSNPELRV